MSTHTTLQFVVHRSMPVMRLSLSPEVPLEQVEFAQIERRDPVAGEGELYLYRPRTPLAPNTTYEATLEIGYTDGTGQEHRTTRIWHFTTSAAPEDDYDSQIVLPLLQSRGEGGNGAAFGGELVVEGRCLYLEAPARPETGIPPIRTIPLFEEGTVWWEGETLFHRGNRYEIGDMVTIGGGEAYGDLSRYDFVQEPDESCDTQRAWVNVQ